GPRLRPSGRTRQAWSANAPALSSTTAFALFRHPIWWNMPESAAGGAGAAFAPVRYQRTDPVMSTSPQHAASVHPLPAAVRQPAPAESHGALKRNPGMALDLGWLQDMRHVNRSALERR